MSGNDLVFPAVERDDDKVLKHFPGDFDCRFQFFDLPNGIEIIFRRHKVVNADFLHPAFSGTGGRLPAFCRGP